MGEREVYPDNLLCGMAVSPPCDLVSNSVAFRQPKILFIEDIL